MAKSQYEYVKHFERPDNLLPHAWIVVRIDGKGFHKFSDMHHFEKPNDSRALKLMNHAAREVIREVPDVTMAYGESDEYSFLFARDTKLYSRREAKLTTLITSLFTAHYMYAWSEFFPDEPLTKPPCFDGRAVVYPAKENVRHYFAWRQADCHINNLYNTVFWALRLKGGQTEQEAVETLRGTVSADKNELLHSKFGLNYNDIDRMLRKGTIIAGESTQSSTVDEQTKKKAKSTLQIVVSHVDIIKDRFWNERPHLLE